MFKSKNNNNIIFSEFVNNSKLIKDNFADDSEKCPNLANPKISDCTNKAPWPCCGGRGIGTRQKGEKDKDFSARQAEPYFCFYDIPFDNDKNIIYDKLDDSNQNYNNIRNGNYTGEGAGEIKEVIESLEANTYCADDKRDDPQIKGKPNPKVGDPGYLLRCRNMKGQLVPDCACDPNCWPNVLGGVELKKDAKSNVMYFGAIPLPTITDEKSNPPSNIDPDKVDGQCPEANFNTATDTLSQLQESMGMDKPCKTSSEHSFINGEIDGNSKMFGGIVDTNFGGTFTASTSKNTTEGCGIKLLNVMKNTTNIQTIQCQLNTTVVDLTTGGTATSDITIDIDSKSEGAQALIASQQATIDSMNQTLKDFTNSPNTSLSDETYRYTLDVLAKNVQSAVELATTRLEQTTITAQANSSVTSSINIEASSAIELVQDIMSDISQSVQDNLKADYGDGAIGPNVNSTIDNEVANNIDTITRSIVDIQASASVSGSAKSGITLKFPPGTKLSNLTIDANSTTSLTSTAMVSVKQTMSLDITNKLVSDAHNAIDLDIDASGLDELINAINRMNSDYRKVGTDSINAGNWIWIIVGIIVVVGLVMLFMPDDNGESAATKLAKTAADSQKPF